MQYVADLVLASLYSYENPLLIGPPGIGKTAMIRSVANRIGGKAFFVYLSQKEACEVHGFNVISKQTLSVNGRDVTVVEPAPPSYAIEAVNSMMPVILAYDELTCVPHSTAAAALSIFSEHELGGMKLDMGNIGMVACANPPEQAAGGWNLPAPTANRFNWIEVTIDRMEWAENFVDYWGDPPKITKWGKELEESMWAKSRVLISAYIRSAPSQLLMVPKDA